MERDFMGLSSKEPQIVVKQEDQSNGYKDIGCTKGQGMHWPFASNFSALPHLMSFKASHDDKAKKITSDHHLPTPSHFAADARILGGITMKSQLVRGVPVETLHPMVGSYNGNTIPGAKPADSPAQLTLFYAGSVSVFDNISPDKAQAIMILAANIVSTGQPKFQTQSPTSAPAEGDGELVNQDISALLKSGLSSPVSVSSNTGAQSGSGSTGTEEIKTVKTVNLLEPPSKMLNRVGSVTGKTMIATDVPQARKNSLARFLEKRKERVMNAAPYNVTNKSEFVTR